MAKDEQNAFLTRFAGAVSYAVVDFLDSRAPELFADCSHETDRFLIDLQETVHNSVHKFLAVSPIGKLIASSCGSSYIAFYRE
jgi:succinylglutamate desuccinylase